VVRVEEEDLPTIQIMALYLHLVLGHLVKETTVVQHIIIQLEVEEVVQGLLEELRQINREVLEEME
jgi:hypothetical protein